MNKPARPVRSIPRLEGSGTALLGGGVTKTAESEIVPPAPGGLWVNVMDMSAGKGPPLTPPCKPGVQLPRNTTSRKPVTDALSSMIEVLVKWPNTELPNIRLAGLVVLNETPMNMMLGMPAKTPVLLAVETRFPIMKLVAVLMFPVGEPLAIGMPKSMKAWVPVGTACAPLVAERKIARVTTPRIFGVFVMGVPP